MRFERGALTILLIGALFSVVCQWRIESRLNQLLEARS